ncbi:MAG: hypothetical protein AB7U73_15400 [Pirellulales bacterium]
MTESRNMSDEQQQLDRLVDGELTPAARRELLEHLEQESGGWRRCAMAFLEAQSWGQDFSVWLSAPVEPGGNAGDLPVAAAQSAASPNLWTPQRRWLDRAGTLLAIAASFVIAFGLGVASRRMPNSTRPDRLLANGVPAVQESTTQQSTTSTAAPTKVVPGPVAPTELAAAIEGALDAAQAGPTEERADGASPIWLPSGLPGDESLLGGERSPALPAYVQRAFERSGHAIEEQHELWPVQLENGAHALVPIERVKVRYVGSDFK